MVASGLLESALTDLKNISSADFCICDEEGRVLVTTFDKFSLKTETIVGFMENDSNNQETLGYHFFKLDIKDEGRFAIVVDSKGKDGYMLGRIAVSELRHLYNIGTGKLDINDFYRNLISGQMLPSDIYAQATRLKIVTNVLREVYCIEVDADYTENTLQLISNMFSESRDDNVCRIEEGILVLVKRLDEEESEAEDFANQIVSMINTELMITAKVTYGKVRRDISEIVESYKEARIALEVSKIFFEEKNIASYSSLGIGRIIHELPRSLCETFLEEVFGTSKTISLSEEEIQITDKFFENNLSVAETSRVLYMHRSTLVYKLDKIKKVTGLDIRLFEDALTLKIALMVAKYIKYNDMM